ncbi:hypothetical protein ACFE04_013353 [Oxalis oulophora]
MDAAVDDGVDILSLSLGGGSVPFYADSIAIGAFGAIKNGILVSCSAGNDGPFTQSLSNEAPWILTVGASTIDRTIEASAKLGNGESYGGESLFQPSGFPSTLLSLVVAGANETDASFCSPGSLRSADVSGKIVLCERGGGIGRVDKGQAVKDAGGSAMILVNDESSGYSTLADAHVIPATHVSYAAGLKIKAYINATSTPTAAILFDGTVIGNSLAPEVTSFSSRGPSIESPGIFKPDILGPGVSILAAWPVSVENNTETNNTFNVISGTSMSCPHLSGISALLKSAHPDWSPAAIKSAIMTAADLTNLGGKSIVDETHFPADIFAIGAGHVNPSKANDPGLLYDTQPDDYIPYLCGLKYTDVQIRTITGSKVSCSNVKIIPEAQLNYPGFAIKLGSTPQNYTRSVTNVGNINTLYTKEIVEPEGVQVDVLSEGLEFSGVNQTLSYGVKFTRKGSASASVSHGYIKWCPESSQLAAIDAAVRDAVDIISISIGGGSTAFYDDTTSVAAFGATEKGILVSASAGNKGPSGQSLSNEALWILTVGASTIDRIIAATAKLGNGDEFVGQTLFQPKDFPSTQFPLVYAGKNGDTASAFCAPGSLANADVLGKVVLCGGISRVKKGQTVEDAGGAAMILMNNEDDNYSIKPEFHVLPATYVSYTEGLKIKDYENSTPLSTAAISFNGTQIGDALAPEVMSFSSRGPSIESPGIMKPDILGPGMSILAAWPFSYENDLTVNNFYMKSGTSMSCPHLSGVAALLKSAHPDWSPTVIKSAIMTSADLTNLGGNPIVDETHFPANIFAVGAGYTGEQVTVITRRAIDCSVIKTLLEAELNYPGFFDQTRIWVEIVVFPDEIVFSGENKITTYNITFTRKEEKFSGLISHGHITWKSSRYAARIPIAITFE